MSIPGSASPLFFTAAADAAAAGPIKSVRFNSADSAYLNRTPSSSGNRKTWTWSGWVKRSSVATSDQGIFGSTSGATFLRFKSNQLNFIVNGATHKQTSQVFRDNSSWYHFVWAVDTTQATASDRSRFYVNGVEVTDWGTDNAITQNTDTGVNNAVAHVIGATDVVPNDKLDAYLADFYLIDGSQLDPTSFGAFDDNGVWQSASYSGTFGTNGFHLFDFANESGIGNDSSGNDNDFTANNLSSTEVSSVTNPTWYAASSYYSDVADVIANGTNKGSGAWTASSEFVYLVVNDGGTPGSNNVSAGNMPILWVMYRNTGGTLTRQGSFGATEFPSFDWSDSTGTYTIANSADYYLFSDEDANPPTNGAFSGSIPALTTASFRTSSSINKNLDVLRDVPTNGDSSDDSGAGGEVSGNYCTWNPLDSQLNFASLANGNLEHTGSSSGSYFSFSAGTIGFDSSTSTGFYFEVTQLTYGDSSSIGLHDTAYPVAGLDYGSWIGSSGNPNGISYVTSGTVYNFGSTISSQGTYTSNGDVIGVAVKDNKIWFSKNGTYISGNPSTGTSPTATLSSAKVLTPIINGFTSGVYALNAGQRAFNTAAPTGYKALCTTNLPTPTIADGSDYFDTTLYTGNGSTQTISGLEFSPDFVWIKSRGGLAGGSHQLYDQVRGATKRLRTNGTDAEVTQSTGLTAFTSDGFTVGNNSSSNYNNDPYVVWAWDAGSSTVSNTDGSVTSQIRVNQTAGFSIVSWTSSNSSNGTYDSIGHGLNASPGLVITKRRNATDNWYTAHGFDLTQFGDLNTTDAFSNAGTAWGNGITSSVIGMRIGNFVAANEAMIAYCFAPVAGYSAFGSYTGNGSSDGPFIYTGFKIAFLMFKRTDGAAAWYMYDYKRDGYNAGNKLLYANYTNAEANNSIPDLLSNGFRIRTTGTVANGNGNDYIYIAFAENPFQANGGLAR